MGWSWRPYVSVAERQYRAQKEIARMKKKGKVISPIRLDRRTIVRTFWGKAWCDNLESYSDYENRLPRGRAYVRNGSVMDLKIDPGVVTALVSGHDLYRVEIRIRPLKPKTWQLIKSACSGQIDSLIELLQGRLSRGVMEIMTRRGAGLFPNPAEISLNCSCPDWAEMCKHVAAFYFKSQSVRNGVGARLDEKPELLFVLRQVDHTALIGQAETATAMRKAASRQTGKVLQAEGLSDIFGIELDAGKAHQENRARRKRAAGRGASNKSKRKTRAARTLKSRRRNAKANNSGRTRQG